MYLLNGERKHCVDVSDRGFQYGDGLFETLEVVDAKPLFLEQHLERLALGCKRLLIPMPDRQLLRDETEKLSENATHAVLKLIVTRGQGGRGYRQPDLIQPTRLFSLHPYPCYPEALYSEGVNARFCRLRLGLNPLLAGIKHLNRLEQVMARSEWQTPNIHEGLMLSHDGYVIEGTMSNLFYVKDRCLITPPIEHCGVAGIMRSMVIELARQLGITVVEDYFVQAQLLEADEILLTNSVIGIWPVKCLMEHVFVVGGVTRRLQQAYWELKQQEIAHA